MESRRLSGRGPRALRRLPHAAQCARRGKDRRLRSPAARSTTGTLMPSTSSPPRRCRGPRKRCSRYLRQGWHPDHGVARGPMAEVVSNLSEVPESDVRAIATYMADMFGAPTPEQKRRGDEAHRAAIEAGAATGRQRRRENLCRGLRHLPRHRRRAAVWRHQPGALDRLTGPDAAQRRQHRADRAFAPPPASAARSCRALPTA